jgi:DsbC/DsbD-like thiol-disulfide interchange protein
MRILVSICALSVLLAGAAPSIAEEHVQVQLLADTTAVQAGKPLTVGVLFTVTPGWHVYWTNPGDAGAPAKLKLTLPPGFRVGPMLYPVPRKLAQPGGLTVYAYENELLLTAVVTPPDDLATANSVNISATASWCVCSDVCILGKKSLELSLPAGVGQPDHQELFGAWRAQLPVAPDQAFEKISSVASSDGGASIDFVWKGQAPAGDIQWLPGAADDITVLADMIQTNGNLTHVHLKITPIQGISATSSTLGGILGYYVQGEPPRGVALTLDRRTMQLVPGTASASVAGN